MSTTASVFAPSAPTPSPRPTGVTILGSLSIAGGLLGLAGAAALVGVSQLSMRPEVQQALPAGTPVELGGADDQVRRCRRGAARPIDVVPRP